MAKMRKSASAYKPNEDGSPRFQHWYRDNQVYFITARTRAGFPAFASEEAKAIFWRQFDAYTTKCGFSPWVTSLLDNHYHTIGYLPIGDNLPPMMKGIQGSTAKLVNDFIEKQFKESKIQLPLSNLLDVHGRCVPFWYDSRTQTYFDGCLRDETQATRTYRYVLFQCRRHGICPNPADYAHTRVTIPLETALPEATRLRAFLYGVPYRRYEIGRNTPRPSARGT